MTAQDGSGELKYGKLLMGLRENKQCARVLLISNVNIWLFILFNYCLFSDGLIRIFSTDSNRQATNEVQAAFQEQVDNVNQVAQKEVGGIKVDRYIFC